ncbi:DUF4407 domain-containing protein [Segetibacter sp. 3557_3]|uniref:DUF4407 domain-containing protein n=1 Tax=Segetibacter sp. 3557_3 TaxID=2547429 RepID=UPI001058F4B2|nr:DUF4407 domain-containing protein [Segetibacter sp. 3557_3]TDH18298.1 DUF4407 domain-containing protein [Segetibacter sp. 3557_3]
MSEKQLSLSQREAFTPSRWDKFLWWLSTAEKELLQNCVVDRNRYRIIGSTVFATWSFATLAWTYFWSTISENWMVSIVLGLFMGFIILTIDRALIKGINKFNKNKVAPLLLRSVLAITLGTFMAQPAVLYMFNSEVKLQASLDNEKRKRAKQLELDSLYTPRKAELNANRTNLQTQLTTKNNEVIAARLAFTQEIDGTGGSGKVGIHNIALAKKAEYEKLQQEYNQLESRISPLIKANDSSLAIIQAEVNKENAVFSGLLNNGFLTRIEALNNLVSKNTALQSRYYLIIVILMLVELMPVLAKTLLPAGTYDEKVRLREEMEKEVAQSSQLNEKELNQLYNQLAKENDEAFLRHFFEQTKSQRRDKMQKKLAEWTAEESKTFDNFWEKVKEEMLTKQES